MNKLIAKTDLKFIIGILLVWWFCLFIFTFLSLSFLPKVVSGELVPPGILFATNVFSAWAGWDGGHFLGIAKSGYLHPFQYAFFPLFPLLIKIFALLLGGQYLVSGLFLSNFFLLLALIFCFKLCQLDFGSQVARKTIFFILIFPTSFFLAAVYSESLFLFLVCSSFYFARQKKWLVASFLAALASATRPLGIVLLPAFLFEYLYQKQFRLKIDGNFFAIFFSSLGLVFYLVYLKITTGNPWIFLHAQEHWQRTLSFPWQSLMSYGYSVLTGNLVGSPSYAQILVEFATALIFLLILIFSSVYIRISYLIYSFFYLIATFASGSLLSQPRLVLVVFPAFITLALWSRNKIFDFFLTMAFLLFLSLFLSLFINGFWIA